MGYHEDVFRDVGTKKLVRMLDFGCKCGQMCVHEVWMIHALKQRDPSISVIDVTEMDTRWIVTSNWDAMMRRPGTVPSIVKTSIVFDMLSPEIEFNIDDQLKELNWHTRRNDLRTVEVAKWFANRCNGASWDEDFPTAAPVAQSSFAITAMDGDVPQGFRTTPDVYFDGNTYSWHDLRQVPEGGKIIRITSQMSLWLFIKTGIDTWEVTVTDMRWPTTRQGHCLGAVIEGVRMARFA